MQIRLSDDNEAGLSKLARAYREQQPQFAQPSLTALSNHLIGAALIPRLKKLNGGALNKLKKRT